MGLRPISSADSSSASERQTRTSIENHNLNGFDLPFCIGEPRSSASRCPWVAPGTGSGTSPEAGGRFVTAPGRELIDTLDAVWRYDFATRELPSHGLKAVARHLGVAPADREYIPGAEIYRTYRTDPERVRRYATHDVEEVAGISRLLGGAAYALARVAPAATSASPDAGPATGVIDPLLVRAYMRAGQALPAHETGDDTPHSGAALHLFAAGVAHRIVKADVASLYPSLDARLSYWSSPRPISRAARHRRPTRGTPPRREGAGPSRRTRLDRAAHA